MRTEPFAGDAARPRRTPAGLTAANATRYYRVVILAFADRDTQDLFAGRRVRRFFEIERSALRKLTQLHVAGQLDDLRIPPGNRLEALKGGRRGQYSIRINQRWRLCFRFTNGNAYDVEIVDYH
jgi:proteic killer suppression protein